MKNQAQSSSSPASTKKDTNNNNNSSQKPHPQPKISKNPKKEGQEVELIEIDNNGTSRKKKQVPPKSAMITQKDLALDEIEEISLISSNSNKVEPKTSPKEEIIPIKKNSEDEEIFLGPSPLSFPKTSLGYQHLIFIMQDNMKLQKKDIVINTLSLAAACYSIIGFYDPVIRLGKINHYNLLMKILTMGGTLLENLILNFYFVASVAYRIFTEARLKKINLTQEEVNTFEMAAKASLAVIAAGPFASLCAEYGIPTVILQAIIFASLQFVSIEFLVDSRIELIKKYRGITPADHTKFSLEILATKAKRINQFEYLVLATRNETPSPTIIKVRSLLNQLFESLDQDRGQISENSQTLAGQLSLTILQSAEIQNINIDPLPSHWLMDSLVVLSLGIAAYSNVGYLYSTQTGLEKQWKSPIAAWIFTLFSMSVFGYLVCKFFKDVIVNIANTVYQLVKDENKPFQGPGSPTLFQFLGRHLLTHAMYIMAKLASLLMLTLYFLGLFSWGTSLALQKDAAHNWLHFMEKVSWPFTIIVVSVTVIFNTYASPTVVNGLCAAILRTYYKDTPEGKMQIFLDSLREAIAERRKAGENSAFLEAEDFGIPHCTEDNIEESIKALNPALTESVIALVQDKTVSSDYQRINGEEGSLDQEATIKSLALAQPQNVLPSTPWWNIATLWHRPRGYEEVLASQDGNDLEANLLGQNEETVPQATCRIM